MHLFENAFWRNIFFRTNTDGLFQWVAFLRMEFVFIAMFPELVYLAVYFVNDGAIEMDAIFARTCFPKKGCQPEP